MTNKDCNCRCEHCFAKSFTWEGRDANLLSTAEMVTAIAEFRQNGAFHFTLQGGEPFLNPDIDLLIKACNPSESYITIVSNGAVVSKEQLEHVYQLGVDKIAVSIDSSKSAEHDSFRGLKGCHERAMNTIMTSRKIGLTVSMAVTVTNESIHTKSIQDLFAMSKEESIPIDINIPQPIGNWDGRTDLLITEENARSLKELNKENQLIRRDVYYTMGKKGCPAVKEALYMNIYGDIFPCVFMHIGIGNIHNSFVRDIRRAALTAVPEFREYTQKCLAGEDLTFVGKYVSQGFGVPKPANGAKIFGIKAPPSRTL